MKFEELAKSFTQKELPNSEVELVGEVPTDIIAEYQGKALLKIAAELDLPGFRKGKVPTEIALKRVGEVAALQEATELFVRDFYPELIEVKKIDAVGRPQISITKLAPGNPVGLTIVAAVYPEVKLPKDWKTINTGVELEKSADATDEEVTKTIEDLRKSRRAPSAADAEGALLPELNDEFAKTLGAFETVDALKAQIKKGITEEKARAVKDARRGKIIDKLLEQTTIAIPNVFVESELDKILSQMREDISRMGLQFEDYLKRLGKNEDDLRKEFRDQATKRAKLQLTLNKIASEEKIEPEKEIVESEMKHALEHFKDANQTLLRIHVESVLRNEKVLKLLEGSKDEPEATHDHHH